MNIVLEPHNDDAALFAAYVCLKHKPKIITVLRSFVEASWNPPRFYAEREAESASAAEILGCEWEQWEFPDNAPDWDAIGERFAQLTNQAWRVWVPLYEENGHAHHNMISLLARQHFPRLTFYSTYTYDGGKSVVGDRVQPVNGWVERKREAMACYVSQATHHNTHLPFDTWSLDEYVL